MDTFTSVSHAINRKKEQNSSVPLVLLIPYVQVFFYLAFIRWLQKATSGQEKKKKKSKWNYTSRLSLGLGI